MNEDEKRFQELSKELAPLLKSHEIVNRLIEAGFENDQSITSFEHKWEKTAGLREEHKNLSVKLGKKKHVLQPV